MVTKIQTFKHSKVSACCSCYYYHYQENYHHKKYWSGKVLKRHEYKKRQQLVFKTHKRRQVLPGEACMCCQKSQLVYCIVYQIECMRETTQHWLPLIERALQSTPNKVLTGCDSTYQVATRYTYVPASIQYHHIQRIVICPVSARALAAQARSTGSIFKQMLIFHPSLFSPPNIILLSSNSHAPKVLQLSNKKKTAAKQCFATASYKQLVKTAYQLRNIAKNTQWAINSLISGYSVKRH